MLVVLLMAVCDRSAGFQAPLSTNSRLLATISPTISIRAPSSSALFMGKKRMAKRSKKAEQTRPQGFNEAIDDASDTSVPIKKKKEETEGDEAQSQADIDREKRLAEAQKRMDERPEVSTMLVDEETGIEYISQGKAVMDVVTRKAVQLSPRGPEYRLAQMFPGVPPEIRERYRLDWKTVTVPEIVEKLQQAAAVQMPDGSRDIPPHPSVANTAIDFVLANRDLLGYKMKKTLGRLQMRSMSLGDKEEARHLQNLWKNFLTLENHISAPFRQIMLDAEGRVGPNFGNLDVKSYCGGDLYERTGDYLVLKGMVAHWEKKVIDADYIERTPITKENYIRVLSRGDPKRYLPEPPILFTLKECTQVCAMSQQMTKAFVETPELFDDLPPEVRFLEPALSTVGGTPLRKYVVEEFCPAEGITPEGLREGLRRLTAQLENMQIDPYADITNIIEKLVNAMTVGTGDEERDPYAEVLLSNKPGDPGFFQTYTFNHEKLSLVRFLDSQYPSAEARGGDGVFDFDGAAPKMPDLFNFGDQEAAAPSSSTAPDKKKKLGDGEYYKVPQERAAGRPHMLGWLDLLDEDEEEGDDGDKKSKNGKLPFGKVPPGKIIMEQEES